MATVIVQSPAAQQNVIQLAGVGPQGAGVDVVYEDNLAPAPLKFRVLIDRTTGEFSDFEVVA